MPKLDMHGIDQLPSGRWRARYRDEAGKQHSGTFDTAREAVRWRRSQVAAVDAGQHVAPRDVRMTLADYVAEHWLPSRSHRPTTVAHAEVNLRLHVLPQLGHRPLGAVRQSEIDRWVKGLSAELSATTVSTIHGIVAGIFKAAVRDHFLAESPCEATRLPKAVRREIVPLTPEQVEVLADTMPDRFRALVALSATTGLRQGECLGLTLDRLDLLRGTLRVDRQLVLATGVGVYLGPPKTPASVRTIPLSPVTVTELALHLAAFPAHAQPIRLARPNGHPQAETTDVELLFTGSRGAPIRRNGFGPDAWAPAVVAAGLPGGTGFHQLRHFYASALIAHGNSPKTVQARLGHATIAETYDTYGHLWPDNEDRSRDAITATFGRSRVTSVSRGTLQHTP